MMSLRRLLLGFLLGCALGSAPLWAAITVLAGTAESRTGNGTVTPEPPAGTQAGDVLIAQLVTKAAATVGLPSGWAEVASASRSQNGIQQRIYYLNLSAAPAGSYSWSIGNNAFNSTAVVIYSVRGAQAADCAAASTSNCAGSYQSGGGNQIVAPNIQSQPPTYPAGSLRMAFFASNDGSTAITPALQDNATAGVYLRPGAGSTGVGLHGSYYLLAADSNGGQQTATLSGNENNIGSTFLLRATTLALTCVSDNFNRSSGLGSDWVSTTVAGSFTPAIVGNRLRMTDTGTRESTAVSFQRLFPGASNYVQLTFRYYGYGGSGADGMAVILSDGSVTPQPGGFGGSLGYAPKSPTPGFAGGWLGLGLDEYGNFSNRNDSGPCAPGVASCATSRVQQSVSLRGSTPNYYWLSGTSTLNPTVSTSSGHLYRITIDSRNAGQAMVSVERDSSGAGGSYSTLISSFNAAAASGQAAIPANLILSLTGSTGDATNNHEIDDLQICAQTMNPMTPQIDHYRFTVASTPLTCTPASVTVTACMDPACSSTYAGNVTASLLPTGWVGGDTKTFAGSGASLSLAKTAAGSYTLGIASSNPTLKAFSQSLCSINGSAYSTNCTLSFADAGLLYTVPAQTSGLTSAPITITAAKTDDVTRRCVPAFANVTRTLGFWSGYVSPNSGSLSLAVNGSAIATASPGSSRALSFDANGQATLTLNYPDAGQISLNARYEGSAGTGDAGLTMSGSSTFPVVPYALCVDSPDAGWNCAASAAQAQNPANCALFRTAGNAFNLRVSGKAASGTISNVCSLPTTPNYIQANIPLGSTVFAPTGGDNGSLSTAAISIASGGSASVSTSQREVGVFTLSAVPTAGAYFGQTVPAGSGVFGRFVPAGFGVSASLQNRADLSCTPASSFTYLGEPLAAAITLNALNAAGVQTRNYTGNYARLPLQPVSSLASNGLAFGAQSGTTLLNSRVSASCVSCPAFAAGTTTLDMRVTVGRAAGNAVDGPFNPARFGLALRDADAVGVSGADYNWDLSGASEGRALGSSILYFGRLRVDNAYGSPLLGLRVPTYAQYWNGSSFVKNTQDRCTRLSVPASVAMGGTTPAALYCNGGVGLYGSLSGVVASMNGTPAGGSSELVAGEGAMQLSKPSNNGGGYLDFVLSVADYLKYNWDGADQTLPGCAAVADGFVHDDNPRARIRFGVRRNDSIIYLREVY